MSLELADFLMDHTVEATGKGTIYSWNFCSPSSPCSEGQGDCDSDTDCDGDLICGTNSCKNFHVFSHSKSDCCMQPGNFFHVCKNLNSYAKFQLEKENVQQSPHVLLAEVSVIPIMTVFLGLFVEMNTTV